MVHFPQTSIIFEYFAFKCAFTEKFSFLRKGIDKRLVKIKIIHIDSFGCWCCIIRCTTFVFHYGFYAILCINLIPIESMLFPDRYGCSGEGAERREADEGRSDNGLHPVAHRCAPLQSIFPPVILSAAKNPRSWHHSTKQRRSGSFDFACASLRMTEREVFPPLGRAGAFPSVALCWSKFAFTIANLAFNPSKSVQNLNALRARNQPLSSIGESSSWLISTCRYPFR